MRLYHLKFTTKLLLIIFLSILVSFLILSVILRSEIREDIFREKQDKLFGLTRQLDNYLDGDFNDILKEENALALSREKKIRVLNRRLIEITDFVASGNTGVGVGYYSRELNGVLTYGPSKDFQYTVGTSIGEGHNGLIVMESGKDMVQTGELVRGNIMNCMHPIIRNDVVIGYIWANETVDRVQAQLASVLERVYLFIFLVLMAIYASVYLISRKSFDDISVIITAIETLMINPGHKIPTLSGDLNVIGEKVNDLVENLTFIESYSSYILDAVVSSVLVVSTEGIITSANKSFSRVFEHLKGDIYGKKSKNVFGREIGSLIDDGLNSEIFYEGREIELFDRILKVSTSKLVDDKEKKLGLVLIIEDMTLIRKYERELNVKERLAALGEMGLSVAHEIKNPLTSVKGFTQMLQRSSLNEEKRNEYLRIMDDELNRVNRLLNELLLYGGQSPLRIQNADIEEIIDNLILEHSIGNPDIEYRKDSSKGGDFKIAVDRFKIIQVFENILRNAEDAISNVGRKKITIHLESDRHLSVVFRDSGIGISNENQQKIFNPFFTTKEHGTGFGLPICYRIIKEHNGDIEINSIEGQFTEVSVQLNKAQEII